MQAAWASVRLVLPRALFVGVLGVQSKSTRLSCVRPQLPQGLPGAAVLRRRSKPTPEVLSKPGAEDLLKAAQAEQMQSNSCE